MQLKKLCLHLKNGVSCAGMWHKILGQEQYKSIVYTSHRMYNEYLLGTNRYLMIVL